MAALSPYLKALTGALVAGLGALLTALDGGAGFGDVTSAQWVTVAIATLVALGAVWAVPYKQK